MCLQCLTNAELVQEEVLPGFALYVATKGHPAWPAGHFGLIQTNDPLVVFPGPVLADPLADMTDAEIDALPDFPEEYKRYSEAASALEASLNALGINGAAWLVHACIQAGYHPGTSGSLEYWLMHHLGSALGQPDEAR